MSLEGGFTTFTWVLTGLYRYFTDIMTINALPYALGRFFLLGTLTSKHACHTYIVYSFSIASSPRREALGLKYYTSNPTAIQS